MVPAAGDERGGDDDAARIEMNECGKDVVDAGRKRDSHKRQQIRRCNDAAFVFFRRAMLNQSIDRHGEEAGPKAQKPQAEWPSQGGQVDGVRAQSR